MKSTTPPLMLVLLASVLLVGCDLPVKPSALADAKVLIGCWGSSNANAGLFRLDLRLESDDSFRALVWGHDGSREWASGTWQVQGRSLALEPVTSSLHADFKDARLATAHPVLHHQLQTEAFKFTLEGFSYFGPLAKIACSTFDMDATH